MTIGLTEDEDEVIKLSVIVSSLKDESSLKNCLESILPQKTDEVEIISPVAHSQTFQREWAARYAEVDFIEYPAGTMLPTLLSAGISRSKGEIIAITDSTCVAADDWLASILKAHELAYPVIGGSVEMSGGSGSLTDWAAYFCDYGQFMLPTESGMVAAIPGNNFSIKRPVLEKGREFVENGFWKTLWCRKLQSDGIELFSEPKISVSRRENHKLAAFLVRRFCQGRCFAGMRAEEFSRIKRFVYTIGSPLLPIFFFIRTVSPVFRKRRHVGKLLLSIPVIILAVVWWAAGEASGYFAGKGNSCNTTE
ncbi:MAG: glycosyltransferase [Pyrinomonadaceae bacterium]